MVTGLTKALPAPASTTDATHPGGAVGVVRPVLAARTPAAVGVARLVGVLRSGHWSSS
jgi:hypothetical protein